MNKFYKNYNLIYKYSNKNLQQSLILKPDFLFKKTDGKVNLNIYITKKHNNAKIILTNQNIINPSKIDYQENYNYLKLKSKDFKFLNSFYIYSIFYKKNFNIVFENMEKIYSKNKTIEFQISIFKFINFFKLFSLIYFTTMSKKEIKLEYEYILSKNIKTTLIYFNKKNYNICKNKKKSRLKKSRKKRIFKKMC